MQMTGLGGFRPPRLPRAPAGYTGSRLASYLSNNPSPFGPTADQFQTPAMMQPGYDFSQDPALQRILATDAAARSNAQAAALAAEKQLAIQLGDAKGIIGDSLTAKEAAQNPFSTLATLGKAYKQTQWNTDQAANENNLYYSGARAKQVGQDAYTYQHQQYDARQAALAALATIQQNLANQLGAANANDAAGYQTAAGNATQQATSNGYDPGAAGAPKPSIAGALARKPAATVVYPQAASVNPAFRALNAYRQGSLRIPAVSG